MNIHVNFLRRFFLLFCININTICILAQTETGEIQGNVRDTIEALFNAVIKIEGTNLGAVTDIDGNYVIKNVKPGSYKLIVSFMGYPDKEINVVVESGKTTYADVVMQSEIITKGPVLITVTKQSNTEEAAIKEVKESKQVINVISAEQISKSQDRDAAQVMARVPGVTVIENRFVMIRGLSERYNVVMINDVISPSTEAERRSFSFDLVPSAIIDRMSIYKSGGAEHPGDFAGGVIKIYTRNIPNKNYTTLALSSAYRAGTTFREFNKSVSGKTDFLGFEDGTRKLPENFPRNLNDLDGTTQQVNERLERAGKSLPDNFKYTTSNALPDLRINFDMGRKFEVGQSGKIGNVTSINYSNTYQYQRFERADYDNFDENLQKSPTRLRFTDDTYSKNIRLGILHNWAYVINTSHKIDLKTLFNQLGENQTIVRNGISYYQRADDSLRNYSFRYQTRTIANGQISGKHDINKKRTAINWILGYTYSQKQIPDWRRFRTYRPIGAADSVNYTIIPPSGATTFDAARFYSNLSDNYYSAGGSIEHKLVKDADSTGISIKAGYYVESRSRFSSARWMSYVFPSNQIGDSLAKLPFDQVFIKDNVNSNNGLKLVEGTNPSDKYLADNFLWATYVGTNIPLGKLDVNAGLRLESYNQKMNTATNNGKVKIDTTFINLFPSINLGYALRKKMQIRSAYTRSVNRPEFRELAPFLFYDFDFNVDVVGNPNLIPCNIHNADLRWEFYPSVGEIFSLGLFYKKFIKPIENYLIVGADNLIFGFRNAKEAISYGAEMEIRKSFDDISENNFIKSLSIVFNGSLIKSEVDLGTEAAGQDRKRPLQGQSPYVVNTGLYYMNENNGLSLSLLYNIFGKRIFIVGNNLNPSIYEMPRHSLDLTVQKKINKKLEARFGIQDILNYKTQLIQDSNFDSKITSIDEFIMITRRGAYYTVGVQYRF